MAEQQPIRHKLRQVRDSLLQPFQEQLETRRQARQVKIHTILTDIFSDTLERIRTANPPPEYYLGGTSYGPEVYLVYETRRRRTQLLV